MTEKTENQKVNSYEVKYDLTKALRLIKHYEGLRLKSYRDSAGNYTIGYGHKQEKGEKQEITEQEAENLLLKDAYGAFTVIDRKIRVMYNADVLNALTDFIYNLGAKKFMYSDLHLLLLHGATKMDISRELMKWIYIGKKIARWQCYRRKAECILLQTGIIQLPDSENYKEMVKQHRS